MAKYRITLTTDGKNLGKVIEDQKKEYELDNNFKFKVLKERKTRKKIFLYSANYMIEGNKINE